MDDFQLNKKRFNKYLFQNNQLKSFLKNMKQINSFGNIKILEICVALFLLYIVHWHMTSMSILFSKRFKRLILQ